MDEQDFNREVIRQISGVRTDMNNQDLSIDIIKAYEKLYRALGLTTEEIEENLGLIEIKTGAIAREA